jgi:hypothetical protein
VTAPDERHFADYVRVLLLAVRQPGPDAFADSIAGKSGGELASDGPALGIDTPAPLGGPARRPSQTLRTVVRVHDAVTPVVLVLQPINGEVAAAQCGERYERCSQLLHGPMFVGPEPQTCDSRQGSTELPQIDGPVCATHHSPAVDGRRESA